MARRKYIFVVPETEADDPGAGTRRRVLSVCDTLIQAGYPVEKQVWGAPPSAPEKHAVYVFQLYHQQQVWPWLTRHLPLRYAVDMPESLLTAQKDFCKYATLYQKVRHAAARMYYKIAPPDPFLVTREMLENASVVLCGSELQVREFGQLNDNVFSVYDAILYSEYSACKLHTANESPTLVWEGYGCSLFQVGLIADALREIQAKTGVGLRVSTSPDMGEKYLGTSDAREFLSRLGLKADFNVWKNGDSCACLLGGNIAIVPLASDRQFCYQKGPGKVQMFHALGMPVIATDIPSYRSWIRHGEDGFLASTKEQWVSAIDRLAQDWTLRAEMGRRGAQRAWSACSPTAVAEQWFSILEKTTCE
jgi:hypothetical protein